MNKHARNQTSLLIGAVLAAAAVACTGVIGGDESNGGPSAGEGAAPNNVAPAAAAYTPKALPLARLTRSQYESSVRDIFAPIVLPSDLPLPPADVTVSSAFDGNTATQTPSPGLVEAYQSAAVKIAAAVMSDSSFVLQHAPAVPATRAEEDACVQRVITEFGKKAFRRPMSAEDIGKLTALYVAARTDGSDFAASMRMLIQAFLQSPTFLYRIEIGTPVAGKPGIVQLGPFEIASRLSYLLLNSTPDATLFDAANANELTTVESVDKHARRLLADPRSHEAVLNFYRQWLRLDKIGSVRKDGALFPEFTATTAALLRTSAEKRVESVFFGDGSLRTLLTGTQAWVNDALAPYYGVPGPGPEMKLVPVDASQRAGILTDVGLLSLLSHQGADSPVLRGVYVLDRLACTTPPPPPPDVSVALPPPNAAEPKTVRERFELLHEQGSCGACHKAIDGIGFAFGHYDAVGKWRATELGLPIDDSGRFEKIGDLEGTFAGAVGLGQRLADSRTVQTCVASNWMRYALGIDAGAIDTAQLALTVDAFTASGLDMRELVIALVKSDAFRTRFVEQ